jgi:hypothetical protein
MIEYGTSLRSHPAFELFFISQEALPSSLQLREIVGYML